MSLDEIKEEVMQLFDRRVADLTKQNYHDVLEEVISNLEARLDCINEELEAEEDE